MKVVIGHIGEIRAGKETASKLIAVWAKDHGYTSSHHQFRDPLVETLTLLEKDRDQDIGLHDDKSTKTLYAILNIWDINPSAANFEKILDTLGNAFGYRVKPIFVNRDSLQLLARVMKNESAFGNGALSRAIQNRLLTSESDIVQADGMRWLSDEILIRSIPRSVILYTTADFEIRKERAKMRRREGEESKTDDELRKEELAENEIYIVKIGKRADWKIENNTNNLEDLKQKISEFCEVKLLTLLKARE